jgi:hypothetical protein
MQIKVVKYATKLKVSKQIFIEDVCVMKFLPQPSALRQATTHPTEGLLGDESEKIRELCKQEKIDKVTSAMFLFLKDMEKIDD